MVERVGVLTRWWVGTVTALCLLCVFAAELEPLSFRAPIWRYALILMPIDVWSALWAVAVLSGLGCVVFARRWLWAVHTFTAIAVFGALSVSGLFSRLNGDGTSWVGVVVTAWPSASMAFLYVALNRLEGLRAL